MIIESEKGIWDGKDDIFCNRSGTAMVLYCTLYGQEFLGLI
jgi:hypothetical protein